MRRAWIGLAVVLAIAAGCKRHRVGADDQKAPRLLSVVAMSNPRAAGQLVFGFHSMEAGAWRWTEKKFAISLLRPPHSDQRGAILSVKLTIPPVTIDRLKSITLSSAINGNALDPETYSAPGDYVYRRPAAASMLNTDPVRVDFTLDKVIPPTGADLRELGVVVLSIGLESQ